MKQAAFILFISLIIPSLSNAFEVDGWCGYESSISPDKFISYDYSDSLRAKFIFVGFPAENPSVRPDTLMYSHLQPAVVDSVKSWLKSHSQGKLQFTSDSGILFRPNSNFENGATSADSWHADLIGRGYQGVKTDPLYVDYRCRWGEENASGCDVVADLTSWRSDIENMADISFLFTEILYKIYDAYVNGGVPPEKWPFGYHDGIDDDQEVVDLLIFVFMTKGHVWSSGGTINIAVRVLEVENNDFPQSEAFFSNIAKVDVGSSPSEPEWVYQGTNQRQNSSGYMETKDFDIERCSMVVLHEFGHTFGFRDGPPSLQNLTGAGDIGRYYFGNLNIMSQTYMPGQGVPVLGLFNLAKPGWVETIDFTGQNLLNQKIYDLRSDGGGNPNKAGKIYRYRLENQQVDAQYFLFGYHAGKGVDASIWPSPEGGQPGKPVLLSTGLEVQHIVGGESGETLVDIESAFGLYRNISSDFMPNIDLPPFPPGDIPNWGTVAPWDQAGYDNHDLWWVNNDSTTLRQLKLPDGSYGDYNRYIGDIFDFFTADTLEVNGSTWSNSEFSYRSSPNSFGYSDGPYIGKKYRHNLQNVPTSLLVRIKEQHDNPESGPPYMVVDFISVPFGEVLGPVSVIPQAPVMYDPETSDPLEIKWTTEFVDAIDRVDLFFSKNGGISYPILIEENVPVTGDTTSFFWTPTPEDGTLDGRVKVVFKNRFDEYSMEDLNPDKIFVFFPDPESEDFLYPENGEVFSVGDVCQLEWANYFGSLIDSVSIQYSIDEGDNWDTIAADLLAGVDYQVSSNGTSNIYDLVLTENLISKFGIFQIEYYSGVNTAINQAENPIVVLPRLTVDYEDVTVSSDIQYQGEVYSFNSLDVPVEGVVDDAADLFISFESATQEGQLYKNISVQGNIQFARLYVYFQEELTLERTNGTASGDLDNDGFMDLVVTSPSQPGVYHFDSSSGQYINWLNDPSVISNSRDFLNSFTVSLVDFDRNGRLDIHLGRASISGPNLAPEFDRIWEQNSDGSFSESSQAHGLDTVSGITQSIVWCDFDEDGLWEVVIAGAGVTGCVILDEGESNNFIVRENGFPSEFPNDHVIALQWADMDRDGDFDLLATRSMGSSWVLVNEQGLLGSAIEIPEVRNVKLANSVAVDLDNDGWVDVVQALALSGAGNNGSSFPQVRILRNYGSYPGFSWQDFSDQTIASGLGNLERAAGGLLFDDFDRDGGLDGIIGAASTGDGDVVFHAKPKIQGNNFNSSWLGVNLVSAADNYSSLGAVVTLRTLDGTVIGNQVVDGGSSRGGQQPRSLIFGLGVINETLEIEARWPANPDLSTLVLVDPLSGGFNRVITINQGTEIEIFQSSISVSKEFVPETGLYNYIFTWITNRLTDRTGDSVVISDGPNYSNYVTTLYSNSSEVVVWDPEYKIDSTGQATYHHRVEWLGQSCVLGYRFKYEVESCIGSVCLPGIANMPIVRTKICISQ